MTWVKICGLTRRSDVEAAVEAGADAVGFVVAERSPRRVDLAAARELGAGIDVLKVLVAVDPPPAEIVDWVRAAGTDAVQLHGRQAAAAARTVGGHVRMVLRGLPVASRAPDLSSIPPDQMPLLDTRSDTHGGSGRTFNWSLAGSIDRPFVLAGGLGPENVRSAIQAVRPWGVDASSRLEVAPGVKDHGRVAAFVQEARS